MTDYNMGFCNHLTQLVRIDPETPRWMPRFSAEHQLSPCVLLPEKNKRNSRLTMTILAIGTFNTLRCLIFAICMT